MPTDKEIKKEFRVTASKDPDKYYATSVLKSEGFSRGQCTKCKKFYWSVKKRDVCGDTACVGGFSFIGNTPATAKLDYVGVWKKFSEMFAAKGYTPIKRYPVIARWRDDTDFVQASIYDFQPHVVSGAVDPPANPLVVPQFCLRFNDIDNVGITASHCTGFVMIGQHTFVPPDKWDQARYFRDIYEWSTKGMGIPKEELVYHEDAWAGGGNFGPCMEWFSRGVELGNQVYMLYEQTPTGSRELPLKVLDMGMGQERNAWFSQGKATMYEATFPAVLAKLRAATGIPYDEKLMTKFLPFAGTLNADEAEDMPKAWAAIATKIGLAADVLKKTILESAALYSVAEHSRSLLFALADGGLPSNVGGLYNLRVIYRRAQGFIEQHKWKINMADVCDWHAEELKSIFPELLQHTANVRKILNVERTKYAATIEKTKEVVAKLLQKEVTTETLVEAYDNQGIGPDLIAKEAERQGKTIQVPDTFYALVAAKHEKKEQEAATERTHKLPLEKIPETEQMYFADYSKLEFDAKILWISGPNVVLDKTLFYPTSGGQMHDTGTLSGNKVVDVFKQGSIIVHVLDKDSELKVGTSAHGIIDHERRVQITQHHTATHIMNAACRKILGPHINQSGAKKDFDRAYIDITHYQLLSEEELQQIEKEANATIAKAIATKLGSLPRTTAEQEFGMGIYQGGAVPGKKLRIVNIPGIDAQACGGTHLNNTKEAITIKVLKATKVKDGVMRIFFTAGAAAANTAKAEENRVAELSRILQVMSSEVPARAQELFDKWKKARRAFNKQQKMDVAELTLTSKEEFTGDILARTSEIIGTQVEHLAKTCQRFLKELEEFKEKLK